MRFLRSVVIPEVEALGSAGVYVLRRNQAETAEFWVFSIWDSMEAVQGFAGSHPERAVVPEEAQRLLIEFDREAQHYDVLHAPAPPIPPA